MHSTESGQDKPGASLPGLHKKNKLGLVDPAKLCEIIDGLKLEEGQGKVHQGPLAEVCAVVGLPCELGEEAVLRLAKRSSAGWSGDPSSAGAERGEATGR